MTFKRLTLSLIFYFLCAPLFAQESREYGDVTFTDFEFPSTIADTTAGAVILLDKGLTTYNHNFSPTMTNHLRILILKNSELDRANIKIPHSKGSKSRGVKACSYNLESGKIIKNEISRKDIFKEKVSDDIEQEIFTIANVKPGSIIEYTYTVEYGTISSLNTWYFQTSVPVLYSEYVVKMPAFFNYKQRMTGFIPLADYSEEVKHGYYKGTSFNVIEKTFISKNIPAFESEPFISSKENYISKIKFDLSDYKFPNSSIVEIIPPSYGRLIEKMEKEEYYQGIYKPNGFLKEDVESLISKEAVALDNIRKIYEFVQSAYEVDDEMMSTSLRKIHKERKGWRQDINMILAAMYNYAGYEAHIIRLSTKKHGYVNRNYPSPRNFNYSVCMVQLNDQKYILDASEKYLPFNILRPETVNDQGLIISSKHSGWIDLTYGSSKKTNGMSNFSINEDGSVVGNVQLQHLGYSNFNFHKKYDNVDEYKEEFQDRNFQLSIIDHNVSTENPEKLLEKLDFEIDNSATLMDSMIVFNPTFLDKIKDNPFQKEERKFPVTFDAPVDNRHTYKIALPTDFEVTDLPENIAIALPGNGGRFLFSCQQMNDEILINSVFSINKTHFGREEYVYLKEFYAQVIEKQSEEIIIKKKNF
ncbi:DUF3857 domain-containing protein [Marivirga sp. S37H4]|uniref:DUF3857 domain-containing protein n=1 Tax=Marivirga aurantiaca TaxID=2802615 RepID=A0A934WYZ5_9BACT|nr:DUF3857 domain-containing protein [Marivirga aurantiaca]MBK6265594.1 DUF3857 domain-containing protein [Marivirga aurantiaca]